MATAFPFWKLHGTGNDFVLAEADVADDPAWPALARRVCDRHFGVGADGLIFVLPSDVAARRMRIFNPDGSEAEMCGNGIRCFVKYVLDRSIVDAPDGVLTVETGAGILEARATRNDTGRVESVRVSLGPPRFRPQDIGALVEAQAPVLDLPLTAAGEPLKLNLVSMGNPHAVAFLDTAPADFDLERIGPTVEHDPLFAHRTNFEVARVLDRDHVEMRVWERGAGITLACGTGAAAVVVAGRLHGLVGDSVEVRVPGGPLRLEWDGEGDVYLEGPAVKVFASVWEDAE
ncbi:MAG: diaminopimelate epimerase [Dehalococcoidia bacterium]